MHDALNTPEGLRALAERDIAAVYRLLNEAGVPQRDIAAMTGQEQSEVSEILKGRQVMAYSVLEKIAEGLNYRAVSWDLPTMKTCSLRRLGRRRMKT